jgi:hypothetical protein
MVEPLGKKSLEPIKFRFPSVVTLDRIMATPSQIKFRTNWSDFCLAHLFTYQDFAYWVIGLAYFTHPENSRGGYVAKKHR